MAEKDAISCSGSGGTDQETVQAPTDTLKTLKDLFNALMPQQVGGSAPVATEHKLQRATAVLLVEVMRASAEIGDAERSAMLAALRDKFALTADESERLLELADRTARDAAGAA